MVITTKSYSNFDMALDMNTVKQLRRNSQPNAWELAWIAWHYTDEFHTYAFKLKPTGFQIEKKIIMLMMIRRKFIYMLVLLQN
jgi:hypothetical protein